MMGFSETPFVKGGRGDFMSESNPQSLRDSSFAKELSFPSSHGESANSSIMRCVGDATAMSSPIGDGMII